MVISIRNANDRQHMFTEKSYQLNLETVPDTEKGFFFSVIVGRPRKLHLKTKELEQSRPYEIDQTVFSSRNRAHAERGS